jgi:hypothetical protein
MLSLEKMGSYRFPQVHLAAKVWAGEEGTTFVGLTARLEDLASSKESAHDSDIAEVVVVV